MTWVAQWCASWHDQPWSCVRAPGTIARGIICFLVGVDLKVQVPRWVVCNLLVFGSSFCCCGLSNLAPPDHENSLRKWQFARTILLQWGQMRAWWKAHDLFRWSAWSAAGRAANNVANMAASLAPSKLRRDWRRQGELGKGHRLDRPDRSKWPNL